MKARLLGALSACVFTLGFATSVNAAFIGRLPATLGGTDYQAYYDDQLDITWATDANISKDNGQNGLMDWLDATSWVNALEISGVTGWRLPNMDRDGDGNIVDCGTGAFTPEICKDNEYGFMFHENGVTSTSQSPFINVQPDAYWSSTEYLLEDLDDAWNLIFNGSTGGDQDHGDKTASLHAWAVYGGDVAAVPVPAAVWLFGSGLLGLIGMARRPKTT
jgi:hypothetical protein